MKKAILAGLLFVLLSCGSSNKMADQNIWVNSYKVACDGIAPMQCLQIQKGDTLDRHAWQYFYIGIEGFDYEPGNIYKLRVKVDSLDPATIPADGSSLKFTLVEVLSKEPDARLRINDIWVLTMLNKEELPLTDEKQRPRLEIQIADNKVFGQGVCNRFSGTIKKLTNDELSFEQSMGSTKMMCPNIEIEDAFFKALLAVEHYTLNNGSLSLKDADGNEILKFQKTD